MAHSREARRTQYHITVEGILDETWKEWFNGMDVRIHEVGRGRPVTILSGPVADQAALRGMLSRLWDLNLTLVSVIRIDRPQSKGGQD